MCLSHPIDEFQDRAALISHSQIAIRQSKFRRAVYRGRSNASGQVTDLGTLILDHFGGPDTIVENDYSLISPVCQQRRNSAARTISTP